jgi:hypothetical protein
MPVKFLVIVKLNREGNCILGEVRLVSFIVRLTKASEFPLFWVTIATNKHEEFYHVGYNAV